MHKSNKIQGPGPADYTIDRDKATGPKYVIGEKTKELLSQKSKEIPGVGAYTIANTEEKTSTIKSMPKFSFGTQIRSFYKVDEKK